MTQRLTAARSQDTRPQEPIECNPATRPPPAEEEASAHLERKRSLVPPSNFLPAAAHVGRQGSHAGAIPQDIASSCAKLSVPRGNDLSASSAEKKKSFFPQLFNRGPIVSFCQPAALVFVFIHNRLPDSRRREKKKRKRRLLCLEMQYPNMIKLG